MSEEKPLPCAFCGKGPLTDEPGSNSVFCGDFECWPMRAAKSVLIGDWNNMHKAIMEQRRKDFEAGQESASPLVDYPETFDDYIKEQNEK